MRVFLSFPSSQRELAEQLYLGLRSDGNEVFFDRASLPPGEAFDARIREAIGRSDLMIFFVTPESVAAGSYALAELSMAKGKWEMPSGHLLPVITRPTPLASLPPYLRAVTILEPSGNVVAEVLGAFASIASRRRRRILLTALISALALLAAAGVVAWQLLRHPPELALPDPQPYQDGLPTELPTAVPSVMPTHSEAAADQACKPAAEGKLRPIIDGIRRLVRTQQYAAAIICDHALHALSTDGNQLAVYPDLILASDRSGDWNTSLELAGTLRTAASNQRATGVGYLSNGAALQFMSYRLELIEAFLIHQGSIEAVRLALNDLALAVRADYRPPVGAKPGVICEEGSFCDPPYLVCRQNRCVNACPPGQVLFGGTNCVRYCNRDSDCPHHKGPCAVDESTHQGQRTCPPDDPP